MLPRRHCGAPGDTSTRGGRVSIEGLRAGRAIRVDADFSKQLGAPEFPKAPFQVILPFGQKSLQINGAPNVPETAVFAITTDDHNIIEAVRYTTLPHAAAEDVTPGLLPLSWMVENNLSATILSQYGGQVKDRYRTKIGTLDAAVVLAETNNPAGPDYFLKFVALPKPNATRGLAVAIMIDKDKSSTVKTLEDTLTQGFAAQILHSTEFLEAGE